MDPAEGLLATRAFEEQTAQKRRQSTATHIMHDALQEEAAVDKMLQRQRTEEQNALLHRKAKQKAHARPHTRPRVARAEGSGNVECKLGEGTGIVPQTGDPAARAEEAEAAGSSQSVGTQSTKPQKLRTAMNRVSTKIKSEIAFETALRKHRPHYYYSSSCMADFCVASGNCTLYIDSQMQRSFPPTPTCCNVRAIRWTGTSAVQLTHFYQHATTVRRMVITADHQYLITGCDSGEVVAWNVQAVSRKWSSLDQLRPQRHMRSINALVLHPRVQALHCDITVISGSADQVCVALSPPSQGHPTGL